MAGNYSNTGSWVPNVASVGLRSVGALRAGRAAERAANLNAMATIFSASYKATQTG